MLGLEPEIFGTSQWNYSTCIEAFTWCLIEPPSVFRFAYCTFLLTEGVWVSGKLGECGRGEKSSHCFLLSITHTHSRTHTLLDKANRSVISFPPLFPLYNHTYTHTLTHTHTLSFSLSHTLAHKFRQVQSLLMLQGYGEDKKNIFQPAGRFFGE